VPSSETIKDPDNGLFAPLKPPADKPKHDMRVGIAIEAAKLWFKEYWQVVGLVGAICALSYTFGLYLSDESPEKATAAKPTATAKARTKPRPNKVEPVRTAESKPSTPLKPKPIEWEVVPVSAGAIASVVKATKGTRWQATGTPTCFQISLDAWKSVSKENKTPAFVNCKGTKAKKNPPKNGKSCWDVTQCWVVRIKN
ncbi:MAG: hypothetical protein ABH820_03675, partial [Patescibacteria group bacterium]